MLKCIFDQFIYPESTNNLELKKCVAAECAGERSWWKPDIFGTRN